MAETIRHSLVGSFQAWMSVKGAKQGQIKPSSNDRTRAKEFANFMRVYSVDHKISSPRDAASGLPTGKREHHPIRILKENDSTSPGLFAALTTNEALTDVEIRFYRANVKGAVGTSGEEWFFTIKLTNANISEIQTLNDPGGALPLEYVSFTYQKIEKTYVNGGITAMDDWEMHG
jgi:type VI secretion system secreted protein Hcp